MNKLIPYYLAISYLLCLSFVEGVEIKKQKVGDVELAYYTRGQGEPLLFLNPFRSTMAVWDPLFLEHLEKNYTLILFDYRGTGLSTDTEQNNTTPSQQAQDAFGLIKALGYQKINVIGWSMGARIGLELALQQPESVKTLILCTPSPGMKHNVMNTTTTISRTSPNLTLNQGLSLIFPDTAEGRLASNLYAIHLAEGIVRGTIPNDFTVSQEAIQRQSNGNKSAQDIYDQLPNIKTKTLVMAGTLDTLNPAENSRVVGERIPFSWLVYIPGTGHNFISQENLLVAELIHIFIELQKK
jgi:pimeloyl-ACP methyl ester carboxylesterase